MSRQYKRFMKQIGLDKKIEDIFDFALNSYVESIEYFQNYRFEYNETEYDLEPIMILLPLLLGNVKNGDKSIKKEIHTEHIKNDNNNKEIYKTNPVSSMGSLLNDIFEGYSKCGLDVNTLRAITIAKKCNLYDEDLGGYNFDIFEKTLDVNYFNQENDYGELTLSQIFNSAVNHFSFKLFDRDMIVEDFVYLYLLLSAKEFDPKFNDTLKFIKILMEYFLSTKKKGELLFPFEISGDLEEDICEIDSDYLEILNYLDNENLLALALFDMIDVNKEERYALELYQIVYKFILMDFSYKSLAINRLNSLEQLKDTHSKEMSLVKKEQKKLSKELKNTVKKLNDKEKEISKLNKALKEEKVKNKEDFYLNKIADLENKLKTMEGKYIGSNNRVKNLEAKLNNKEIINEDIAITLAKEVETIDDDIFDNINKEVSYEDKLRAIKDMHFFVVGGNTKFFGRLKAVLPNSRHIDILNESCNFTVPKSTDCILNISKVTTHSHIKRAEAQVGNNVPIIKISTYQVSEIVNIIYDILKA